MPEPEPVPDPVPDPAERATACGVYGYMIRTTGRGRRWRARVLLGGLLLLIIAAVFLLEGSRPRASPKDDANGDDSPAGGLGRSRQSLIRLGAQTRNGGDDEGGGHEGFELKLLSSVSGEPLTEASVDLWFGNGHREAESDEQGVVQVELPSDDNEPLGDVEVEVSGYEKGRLSAAEVAAMLEAGTGTLRLLPFSKLTARVLDAAGKPIQDFEVCYSEEDNEQCEHSTEGTVEITGIPRGEHMFWASAAAADDNDDGRGDHVAYQSLRFEPGESKGFDFKSSARLDRRVTVQLFDKGGRPFDGALIDLEIEPRHQPAKPLERAQLAAARNTKETAGNKVSWMLQEGGWYRVSATPRVGPERTVAEVEIYVGEKESAASLTIPYRSIRCLLLDAAGVPVPVSFYRLTFASPDGRDSFGGAGSENTEMHFFWHPDVSVEVKLFGQGGRYGVIKLSGPDQRCEARAVEMEAPS